MSLQLGHWREQAVAPSRFASPMPLRVEQTETVRLPLPAFGRIVLLVAAYSPNLLVPKSW